MVRARSPSPQAISPPLPSSTLHAATSGAEHSPLQGIWRRATHVTKDRGGRDVGGKGRSDPNIYGVPKQPSQPTRCLRAGDLQGGRGALQGGGCHGAIQAGYEAMLILLLRPGCKRYPARGESPRERGAIPLLGQAEGCIREPNRQERACVGQGMTRGSGALVPLPPLPLLQSEAESPPALRGLGGIFVSAMVLISAALALAGVTHFLHYVVCF